MAFTIKYRMSDGAELIIGELAEVTSSMGEFPISPPDVPVDHPDYCAVWRRAVTGHRLSGETVTLGPVVSPEPAGPAIVWVMNEAGATVAKYDL